MGRRPVKVKIKRLHSRVFDVFGFRSRVDVVAQQVLDHEAGIFKSVKSNDIPGTLREIEQDRQCLHLRDSVGAAPVHIAFLYGHYELGKAMVRACPELATLTYTTIDATGEISPYEGENILHIVIVHRQRRLARWLVQHVPALVNAECIGKFFRPSKTCYFGGTPLLFALSSNQISVALDILEAAERLKHMAITPGQQQQQPHQRRGLSRVPTATKATGKPGLPNKRTNTVAATATTGGGMAAAYSTDEDGEEETSIFMTDSFGNNVLHLAVIHDLPNVYDFAIHYAMQVLGNPTFSVLGGIDPSLSSSSSIVTALSSSRPDGEEETVDAADEQRRRARLASFSPHNTNAPPQETRPRETLVDFLRRVDTPTYDRMMRFLMARNSDELTPLSLAAAIGQQRMFQYVLQQSTSVAWSYGPITALNIPLRDLEEPEPRPRVHYGRFQMLHDLIEWLPYPLAPKGVPAYKTAIQCLCSYERLSNTISKNNPIALQQVHAQRLEMLKLLEVKQLLHKKWKYVGKQRFMSRWAMYTVFLGTLNISTVFQTDVYTNATAPMWERALLAGCEVICFSIAILKFINEAHQLAFNFRAYISEAGAGRLDNVCTLMATSSLFLSGVGRAVGRADWTDAMAAIALIFAWFYFFFFLLGFRSTGPFVIMILNMIQNDIARFIFVYIAVMAGFSQALYLVHDGRSGAKALLSRVRMLVIAGFTGEVNYDDNYTSGRMNTLTQLLMLGYIILVMILLVNLLIAMMGNTYTEILAESEQRWVAERANIMATIENQCPDQLNRHARHKYAIPLIARDGKEELYLQLEMNNMATWKEEQVRENEQEAEELRDAPH